MAMLQVRDMDDRLYDRLKFAAKTENRSISQQVITILQSYFTSVPQKEKNATEQFLKLVGKWGDNRSADEIVEEIRDARTNSKQFGDLTLVTNNTKHFDKISGLKLENWKK